MGNVVHVRVEARPSNDRGSGYILSKIFKKACENYGIIHAIKDHQFYNKPSEKKRKKKRKQKDTNRYDPRDEWENNG